MLRLYFHHIKIAYHKAQVLCDNSGKLGWKWHLGDAMLITETRLIRSPENPTFCKWATPWENFDNIGLWLNENVYEIYMFVTEQRFSKVENLQLWKPHFCMGSSFSQGISINQWNGTLLLFEN